MKSGAADDMTSA